MMLRALVFAVALALGCAPAAAQSAAGPALALYKAGQYQAAINAGLAENSENGFTIAARAALAEANLRETPCLECLQRAEGYARRAIAAGGKMPESYVYLAAALGHQSRIIGIIRARLGNYGDQSREALETALRLRPNFSWALAALGSWNIEVVRVGGSWLGDMFYEASFDKGVGLFRRAIAAEPANLVIHFQFALAVAAYDFDGQRPLIMSELTTAAGGTPSSAYDAVVKQRAARLKTLVEKRDDDAALALVRKFQGYPDD
jgi:hypothetical protein